MERPAPIRRVRRFGALVSAIAALGVATLAPAPSAAAAPTPTATAAAAATAAGGPGGLGRSAEASAIAQAAPSYVALGDSYTAGPLIPSQQTTPLGCLRSDHDYPHLVAPSTGLAAFRDVSCSGADTDDMFTTQNVTPGPNPPQLDGLDSNTRLVTLGIGGNDIGFSGIIQDCVTLWPFGTPCRDRYVVNGVDELSGRIAATALRVAAVLDAIHVRAPAARILVVGYPAIFPDTGNGCWPSMPMAFGDVPYLRSTEKNLNAMLAAEATADGATYVDTYTPSIGHDVCRSTGTRWVEPIIPGNAAAPVHPNARGMAGMAAAVTAAL
jgi:lysophospholipase L1-like esterase